MAGMLGFLDAAAAALSNGQDTHSHLQAVSRFVDDSNASGDPAAAEQLLRDLHDRLLPQCDGDAAAGDAAATNAVLGSVMTECLEATAGLANLSSECCRLSEALVLRFATCAPREAGILLLACLGRQVG